MSGSPIGFDPVTTNHSTPMCHLGTTIEREYPAGTGKMATFVYVQVVDATAADDGDVLTPASATNGFIVTQDRDGSAISAVKAVGVAVNSISENYYGFILCRGTHDAVLGDGSVAAGDFVVPDSGVDGGADTMADGEEEQVFGLALAADAGSPAVFACLVNCM